MMMHFKFEISRQLGTSQQVSAHSTMHIYIISYDERYTFQLVGQFIVLVFFLYPNVSSFLKMSKNLFCES